MDDLAVGGDDLHAGDSGGEVAVLYSGAVGCGGAGSDGGDVWQGSEVVKGESLFIDIRREDAIADACADGDGLCVGVDDHRIESGEGDLGCGRVGDGVEAVAAAERAELGGGLHQLLGFFDGLGSEQVVGVVGEVSGPVGAGSGSFAGGEAGEQGACEECARGLQEFSLIHVPSKVA